MLYAPPAKGVIASGEWSRGQLLETVSSRWVSDVVVTFDESPHFHSCTVRFPFARMLLLYLSGLR